MSYFCIVVVERCLIRECSIVKPGSYPPGFFFCFTR
ncbi:hypothetical protein EVA_15302 [gut metagenome]|uniref:Uncharacterized protein n=1 Tax=gut metagenome TaxID=749906 RepID=J9G466_9ZZZZ